MKNLFEHSTPESDAEKDSKEKGAEWKDVEAEKSDNEKDLTELRQRRSTTESNIQQFKARADAGLPGDLDELKKAMKLLEKIDETIDQLGEIDREMGEIAVHLQHDIAKDRDVIRRHLN